MLKRRVGFSNDSPSSANDPITFYAAGCEADGKGSADNDYVYTTTAEISALTS